MVFTLLVSIWWPEAARFSDITVELKTLLLSLMWDLLLTLLSPIWWPEAQGFRYDGRFKNFSCIYLVARSSKVSDITVELTANNAPKPSCFQLLYQ